MPRQEPSLALAVFFFFRCTSSKKNKQLRMGMPTGGLNVIGTFRRTDRVLQNCIFPLSAHDGPPLTDLTAIVNFKGENKCQSHKWQRRHLQFNPAPSFFWSSGGRRNHWAHCRVRLTVGRCVIKIIHPSCCGHISSPSCRTGERCCLGNHICLSLSPRIWGSFYNTATYKDTGKWNMGIADSAKGPLMVRSFSPSIIRGEAPINHAHSA